MKPHVNTTPTEPVAPRLLPSAKVQFPENIFAAVRTAGALLVGNSALIYFGIVGTHVAAFERPLWLGLTVFIGFALPVALIERNTYVAIALKIKELERQLTWTLSRSLFSA